jgi:ribonuclease E
MPIAPLLEGAGLEDTSEAFPTSAVGRRPEPELVAVPMDATEEALYGWLGFSPTLLLDEPPADDNVVVRVVRPDADAEAVLEEARQQLASNGSRRRRGRGGRGSASSGGTKAALLASAPEPDSRPASVDITLLPPQLEPETVVTVSVPTRPPQDAQPQEEPLAVAEPELDDDGLPRRRRRRSSARA